MSKSSFVVAVAGTVLTVDQLSKWYIRQTLTLYESIPVVDSFFNIVHVRNEGGAFSVLANTSEAFRLPFFLIASGVAIAALAYFLRHVPDHQRWLLFALAGVLGGAVGNLVDRVMLGQVTDFLDFYWLDHHWPAFNVADSFITIGVGILLIHSLFSSDRAPRF